MRSGTELLALWNVLGYGSKRAVPLIADKFFSELHRHHLRAKGYRKERRVFSRDHAEFTERVQFQGSSWNSSGSPWVFYVNVGVQFRDLPRRRPDRDLPHSHCWARIESIVPDAPQEFEFGSDDERLAGKLVHLLDLAHAEVSRRLSDLRERYEKTGNPWLSCR